MFMLPRLFKNGNSCEWTYFLCEDYFIASFAYNLTWPVVQRGRVKYFNFNDKHLKRNPMIKKFCFLRKKLDVEKEINMIVTMTTSISLHIKDEKEHFYGTRREIKFWEKDKSRCVINMYMAKLMFMLLRLIKKANSCEWLYLSVRWLIHCYFCSSFDISSC